MAQMVVEAQTREGVGKGAARKMRRAGMVPAVVYGGKKGPVPVSVDPRAVQRILVSEAGQNSILTLQIKGHGKTPAMIREWQVDPVKGLLMHVDFLRVALDERLRVNVPVHARGEAVGVKQQGGLLELIHREVEVECLPGDIPGEFVVDVSELAINQGIRAGDLQFNRDKVRLLTEPEQVLVHVVAPRAVEEEAPAPAEEAAVGEGAGEPEVIGKGKVEGEAEGEAASAEGKKE